MHIWENVNILFNLNGEYIGACIIFVLFHTINRSHIWQVILFWVIHPKVKTNGTLYMNKIFTLSNGYHCEYLARQSTTLKHCFTFIFLFFLNVLFLDLYYWYFGEKKISSEHDWLNLEYNGLHMACFHSFINYLLSFYRTHDSIEHKHMVPNFIELIVNWSRQKINKNINKYWLYFVINVPKGRKRLLLEWEMEKRL